MRQLPTNELIREVLGEKHPIALGWRVLVETYKFGDKFVNQDGSQSAFERPDSSKDRDRYQMAVGRILMMGSAAFNGPKFDLWDVKPKVGDYVSFERYQGIFKTHGGKDIQYLEDYVVIDIVPDPNLCSYVHFIGN
jgi:co-chaperonin GroES (HSP10)